MTHLPTGVIVTCQDERSQIKNRAKALRVIKARIMEKMLKAEANKVSQNRRVQVGTGDRSEKIRTYNFPQNRVTDHRIGLTLHSLDNILEGQLGEVTGRLREEHRQARISALSDD